MKNFKEIIIILVVSIAIGLLYNSSQPKPLPLIYKKKELAQISDDLLFNSANGSSFSSDISLKDEATVTYEQMLKIVASDDFVIVDARSSDFHEKNKIGNAINIFPYDDESEVMNKVLDLPSEKTIIVYCDGGNCDSSHKIAEILINFGYKTHIYSGGWDEWSKKQGVE
ncbi:MAG: rhodanese-like domain-containing protein [Ignavibacteriae bacterium]|nr:rhodanese-like domain-containing protein [Ignavibacteriota bacterium]